MKNNETPDLKLTKREKEVLQLIVAGRTCRQIAGELNIGISTVEKHRENLMRKLDAHNIAQLIAKASLSEILDRLSPTG